MSFRRVREEKSRSRCQMGAGFLGGPRNDTRYRARMQSSCVFEHLVNKGTGGAEIVGFLAQGVPVEGGVGLLAHDVEEVAVLGNGRFARPRHQFLRRRPKICRA